MRVRALPVQPNSRSNFDKSGAQNTWRVRHVREKHFCRCRDVSSLLELRKQNSRSELSGPRIRKALVRSQLVRRVVC